MAVGFILNTTWKSKMEIPVKPPGQTTRRNQMRFLILLLLAAAAIGQGARFEAVVVKPAAFIVANPAAQGPNDGALYSAAGLSRWWMVSLGYETLYIDADARKFPFVRSTIYSISAKIPNGIGRDRIPEMVRNLLADRFGLMCHTEQRTVKGFSLTLTDLHKLKTNGAFTEHPKLPEGLMDGSRLYRPLPKFTHMMADALSTIVGGPVVDKTGIDGEYTLWVELSKGDDGLTSEVIESLASYGLKLKRENVTIRYVVIDKINKTPAEE
jgi:uncharacterized protein (TIGR03435 family)